MTRFFRGPFFWYLSLWTQKNILQVLTTWILTQKPYYICRYHIENFSVSALQKVKDRNFACLGKMTSSGHPTEVVLLKLYRIGKYLNLFHVCKNKRNPLWKPKTIEWTQRTPYDTTKCTECTVRSIWSKASYLTSLWKYYCDSFTPLRNIRKSLSPEIEINVLIYVEWTAQRTFLG